jgi:hypothetical protein
MVRHVRNLLNGPQASVNVSAKKHFQMWQQQINTRHPGDDRMAAHNNGIIVHASTSFRQEEMNGNQPSAQPRSVNPVYTPRHNDDMIVNESIRVAHNNDIIVSASTSIWQEEMSGDQPSAQPPSANPVDTRRNNYGMIINESIILQQEESIVTQATVQPRSAIQHCQYEPPNIDSARVERASDNNDIQIDTSSGIQQEKRVIAVSTKQQLSPDDDMRHHEVLTNNSPSTPNSAPLHRTEMINNVLQDIDENIKVFINKMFDRRDKEIIMLKRKVDKLNKDCAVLTKNNDQLRGLSNGLKDVLKKYLTKDKKGC